MNERPKAVQKARRERRLGVALRENLKRRKAQARGRTEGETGRRDGAPHDSAGFAEDKQGGQTGP